MAVKIVGDDDNDNNKCFTMLLIINTLFYDALTEVWIT
jgi:hypothetical protein